MVVFQYSYGLLVLVGGVGCVFCTFKVLFLLSSYHHLLYLRIHPSTSTSNVASLMNNRNSNNYFVNNNQQTSKSNNNNHNNNVRIFPLVPHHVELERRQRQRREMSTIVDGIELSTIII